MSMQVDIASTRRPPPGLTLRPYRGENDLSAIAEVMNAENIVDAVAERETVESVRGFLSHPSEQFDAARDVRVAELDGRVVAAAGQDWVDTRNAPERMFRFWGAVHPDVRRRGIGSVRCV